MKYTFENLSPPDFEDLVRDLIGAHLKARFSGFGPGPDGGIDGRHASAKTKIILQAKHYVGSAFSDLKSVMKRSRPLIDKMQCDRYLLVTSRNLSPANKTAIATEIGQSLKCEDDIFSVSDLNDFLKKFPDIERSHIKLWMGSTAVLDCIVNATRYGFTLVTKNEIAAKIRVYVTNPSYDEALKRLEKHHVLIITGPPGVGKTTLADMVVNRHAADDWELIAIRNLDEGFAAISDQKKQIFYFDDFLGQVALDQHALANKDSGITKFIKKIARSPNARFVLTTRTHILEHARTVSEPLSDPVLHVMRYALNVEIYTRMVRARIFYNHLVETKISKEHISALFATHSITKIIDHKNYNPRIIESMTDEMRVKTIEAENYPEAFLDALENPESIWEKAFTKHISPACRHLLISMYFLSEQGAYLDEVRRAFEKCHAKLSAKYGTHRGPKDFEEALRVLEGGFVTIHNGQIGYVNPSLRDYLKTYLADPELLADLAPTLVMVKSVRLLLKFSEDISDISLNQQKNIAIGLKETTRLFPSLPVMRRDENDLSRSYFHDLGLALRVGLVLELFDICGDDELIDIAQSILKNRADFNAWLDGKKLVELRKSLRSRGQKFEPLYSAVSNLIGNIIEFGIWPNALEGIASALLQDATESTKLLDQCKIATMKEINSAENSIEAFESHSDLSDYAQELNNLVSIFPELSNAMEDASGMIEEKLNELGESYDSSESPGSSPIRRRDDSFTDQQIANLFTTLI